MTEIEMACLDWNGLVEYFVQGGVQNNVILSVVFFFLSVYYVFSRLL